MIINQSLVNRINEATKDRDIDTRNKNILYFLIVNYKVAKTIKLNNDEINTIADNLEINNEILDSDNIDDYSNWVAKNKICKKTIEKIREDKKFMLLNYYDIDGNLHFCKIVLDTNYNIF